MNTEIDSASLGLIMATGIVCTLLTLLTLRRLLKLRSPSARSPLRASGQISELLEEQRSRMRHLVAVIGKDDLYAALMEAEADRERVIYSPEAAQDMTEANVSPEHVETVLAHPARRSPRPKDFAIELERDFGTRTLRVVVADPAPGFGPPYVKRVIWREQIPLRPSSPCRASMDRNPTSPPDRLNSIHTEQRSFDMSDSNHAAGDERPTAPEYGPDWVGLDRAAMEARQDEIVRQMREAGSRWREEQKRSEEHLQSFLEATMTTQLQRLPAPSRPPPQRTARPRPLALIERLHVENLKSLAGRHEIPLAPLTLVYGPNSAGKSTVLKALQLFMHAVDTGRFDALDLWRRAFPDVSLKASSRGTRNPRTTLLTNRSLSLGVDYRLPKSDRIVRAELGFQRLRHRPMALVDDGRGGCHGCARKEFFLNYEAADPFDRGDFGDIGPKWEVREWAGGERYRPRSATSTTLCSAIPIRSCSDLFSAWRGNSAISVPSRRADREILAG